MKKSKFEEMITTSFKSETPDVLNKIKSSDQFYVPDKVKKYDFSRFFNKRLSYSLASVFVLAIVLFSILSSGTEVPAVVASTVTIDINPSVQITLDEDDHVINVSAINDEGEYLIDRDIKYKGMTLDEAVEIILAEALRLGYINDDSEDNFILIDVASNRADIKARVEAALEAKIQSEMAKLSRQVEITRENRDELTEEQKDDLKNTAEQFRLSPAKLFLINRIIDIDDTYTVASLKDFSIKELYAKLAELSPEEDTIQGNNDDTGNN